jgi:CBS domain-containing protein
MIVRIMGEGQYDLDERVLQELNAIDNRIVDHVRKNEADEFRADLGRLISTVKSNGKQVDAKEITKSDIIIPPKDLTLEEAKGIFKGDGLIKD